MEMTAVFWVATLVMVVIAVGFVARPLLLTKRSGTVIALTAGLPVVAAGLYLALGSPSSTGSAATRVPSAIMKTATATENKVGSVASMVDGLAARLEQSPGDAGSWLLLARSYKHLNRNAEALAAYEKAAALGQFDADLASMAGGDIATAVSRISGTVSLSESAATVVNPTDTVFVFAKAVDGPAMPIAVLRRAASELPISFVLDDSLSMTPDLKLSDFPSVTITARISRGGDATVTLRSLEAKSGPITIADNQPINLTID